MELIGLVLFVITIIFLLAYRIYQAGTNQLKESSEKIASEVLTKKIEPKIGKNIEVGLDKDHFFFNMPAVVTLFVLLSSLYIILSSKYDAGTQNWAFGSAGAIIGFWLRPQS